VNRGYLTFARGAFGLATVAALAVAPAASAVCLGATAARRTPIPVQPSPTFAGYSIETPGADLSSFSARMSIPRFACPKGNNQALAGDVELEVAATTGPAYNVLFNWVEGCTNGVRNGPTVAVSGVGPASSPNQTIRAVKPGDALALSLTEAGGAVTAVIGDVTTHHAAKISFALSEPFRLFSVGVATDLFGGPVPKFTDAFFSDVTLDQSTTLLRSSGPVHSDTYNNNGNGTKLLVASSNLTPADDFYVKSVAAG
jgi:hypothetical protein